MIKYDEKAGHGDAADVRRRGAGRARRRRVAPRPALHRRREAAAAPARRAGRDRDRQRAPVRQQQEQARRLARCSTRAGRSPHPSDLDEVLRRSPAWRRRLVGAPTPRSTSTGRTTTRSSTAADTLRAATPAHVCATTRSARCTRGRLSRGARSLRRLRRCRSTSRRSEPAGRPAPEYLLEPGGRRRASGCRCAPAEPRRASCVLVERRAPRFTPHELELVEALGESASAAIHNARCFGARRRRASGCSSSSTSAAADLGTHGGRCRPRRARGGRRGHARRRRRPPACGCAATTGASPSRTRRSRAMTRPSTRASLPRREGARRAGRSGAGATGVPGSPSRSPVEAGSRGSSTW